MNTKKKEFISSFNKKFNLDTVFFADESMEQIAHTQGNTVFLNEFLPNVEQISLHEVLHHYTTSTKFKEAKRELLDSIDAKSLQHLVSVYLAKYMDIYSAEDSLL